MNAAEQIVRKVDRYQQHHRPLAFLFGVVKKFGDDRGGSLAALLTYYGFLSLFPLLLLLVTALGFVVGNDPDLQQRLLRSALVEFPIIGKQIQENIHALRATGFALVVGVVGLIWGALGITQVGQHAMQEIWNVRGVQRPGYPIRLLRGAKLLLVLGLGVGATSVLAGLGSEGSRAAWTRMALLALSVPINTGLFVAAFRVLTGPDVRLRDQLPGAVVAGIAWTGLQALGGYLVAHQLRHASEVYGFFGVVLGMLAWIFLIAQITIYSAELNAVRVHHLWPRSIVQPPLTPADERALAAIVRREERRPEESVEVTFDKDART